VLVWAARRVGVERVLPSVIRAEAADRDRYRSTVHARPGMAEEERDHGRTLALASSDSVGVGLALADARHRTGAGGSLRAAVFGANDGLVSNLALIMGVAGGTGDPGVIVLAGVAGLVAGAGSMAAGEWVSVRSQRELYEREIAVERWELEQFPDDERHELVLIYQAKGLDAATAEGLADQIMADPEVALDTLAREELGLNPADLGSPWQAAISSFLAFATGALVPLLPFLVVSGRAALVGAAVASALALAVVGAVISVFTGRSAWRSALRMVAIGSGAALVTYLIGSLVGVTLD
jgi:vacuolar iron transporter family protein